VSLLRCLIKSNHFLVKNESRKRDLIAGLGLVSISHLVAIKMGVSTGLMYSSGHLQIFSSPVDLILAASYERSSSCRYKETDDISFFVKKCIRKYPLVQQPSLRILSLDKG